MEMVIILEAQLMAQQEHQILVAAVAEEIIWAGAAEVAGQA